MISEIAQTIYQQLGGRKFSVMTGAKDFVDLKNGLRFSIGRNKTSANRCEVIYDEGKDLYIMRFYRQTMSRTTYEIKTKLMKEYTDVYCDMLQSLFTEFTGMYTRLF